MGVCYHRVKCPKIHWPPGAKGGELSMMIVVQFHKHLSRDHIVAAKQWKRSLEVVKVHNPVSSLWKLAKKIVHHFACCSQAIDCRNGVETRVIRGRVEIPDVPAICQTMKLKALPNWLAGHLVCVLRSPGGTYHTFVKGDMCRWYSVSLRTLS